MTEYINQRYMIKLIRTDRGEWSVSGYWEIPDTSVKHYKAFQWDLDGACRTFPTRKEALEFCMTQSGIPE